MIYTCTTNPSLDYYLTLSDDLKDGEVARSSGETYDCGGKGVNVSIVLSNLNIPSITLGFLGGFSKDFYVSFLSNYPFVQPMFTSIAGNTRINVKLLGHNETSINAKGPTISKEEFEKFKKRFFNIYPNDVFVLSGNIQDEIKDDIVDLINDFSSNSIKTVLDCSEDVIERSLDNKPFLVNMSNLISDDADEKTIKEKLLEVNAKGVKNVFVCQRNLPSYICFDSKVYKSDVSNDVSYVTGFVDAFIAGFVYVSIRGGDSLESFKYGLASSLATSLSNDLAGREKIEEVIERIEIVEV